MSRHVDQIGGLDAELARHCGALAACRRCGHDERQVVPVLSAARRPLAMLVGQAPGQTERLDRKPFAGRAGRTLFRWLADAGIDEATARERIYISAVTRCYPGPSPSGRGDRVPSPAEVERCASWLEDELRIIRPRVLIPVGRLAISRFLGDTPLASVVGGRHLVRHEGGESVAIPLPHPSGASSWVHQRDHRALLGLAIGLLAEALPELAAPAGRRVA